MTDEHKPLMDGDTVVEMAPFLQCPVGGEDWPMTAYTWSIDLEPPRGRHSCHTVYIGCPVGHEFDLSQAVRSGFLSREHAEILRRKAQRKHLRRMRRPYLWVREVAKEGLLDGEDD